MTSYLGLYILINVFCGALILICVIHSRIGMGGTELRRRFVATMILLLVFFASDTLWYSMDQGAILQNQVASMFLKTVYFLSATIAGYLWFLYMGTLSGTSLVQSRRTTWLLTIPIWAHGLLCLINVWTGVLFWVGADMRYTRGILFPVQYMIIYSYLIASSTIALGRAMRPANYVDRSRLLAIAMFPVLPAISGMAQLFIWRVPFNCIGFTLSMVIVYLTELGQQISQEPLTQLANRKQLMRVLQQNMGEHADDGSLCLFLFDVDDFKKINDTFGHVEGDRAILRVAEALRRAAAKLRRRATVARYGGDEFAIATLTEKEGDVEELQRLIEAELAEINRTEERYRIQLSTGVAMYSGKHRSIRDLINEADAKLYQHKNSKR